jgi:hypothetical protein
LSKREKKGNNEITNQLFSCVVLQDGANAQSNSNDWNPLFINNGLKKVIGGTAPVFVVTDMLVVLYGFLIGRVLDAVTDVDFSILSSFFFKQTEERKRKKRIKKRERKKKYN